MDTAEPLKPDTTPDQLAPLGGTHARIQSLDFIRGIAVMGILLANIVAFGQPMAAYMYPRAFLVPDGDPAGILWSAQFVLVDGKMRGLFTLLFGAGLYLFMEKAWAKGATRRLQALRLAWLMAFGAVHFYLIWRGDILMSYAFSGFIGLACIKWAARTQLIAGLIGYGVGSLVLLASVGPLIFVADTPFGTTAPYADMRADLQTDMADELASGRAEAALIIQGDYPSWVAYNVMEHGTEPLLYLMLALTETVPLILIGMALYRFGLFDGRIARAKLKRWGWIGFVAGTALTLPLAVWITGAGLSYYGTLSAFVGFSPLPRLPVVIGLAALLAAYAPGGTGWLTDRVKAAGRMAFSNYLGTSLVMLLVFHGLGPRPVRNPQPSAVISRGAGRLGGDTELVEALAAALPLRPA